ncbi:MULTISPECIES: hypothetical protein [Methylobacillus]|uniref:Lipoprotein n=1 Tax=Methylobacillus flagellatus (strain ATCC 51484 / DSM 6875 / VKM B-1610 / KT) TaxID=265072 RepID=Q1H208_METFK|nr:MULTISPECIES: hypothetical protein [Methylobacillus]ABE49479.1 hypothetical protein Mfla_1211 [Methylobacillus flagellatus KT]MPS47983.1 hypothetical protein [Methylobacillus sp.]
MEFDQLKLVGGMSAFFLLLGFGCWLLLQTATMGDGPAGADFFGELCIVAPASSTKPLTPCIACVALSHQLVSQTLTLGPAALALPGISAYTEPLSLGDPQ